MTGRTRPQSYAKPGAPRFTWGPTVTQPPPRNPAPDADTAWRGTLSILPDGGLLGELQDMHRWTLTVGGTVQDRNSMSLRSWVRTPGILLPAFEDRGVRSDLTERLDASWPWSMARTVGDAWRGEIAGTAWRLVVTGARVSAGRLGLLAVVEPISSKE